LAALLALLAAIPVMLSRPRGAERREEDDPVSVSLDGRAQGGNGIGD
jgi:hypothetical protein